MGMTKRTYFLKGIAPMICHNAQLALPDNEYARKIATIVAKKKKKTDEDRLLVKQLEFYGGLYLDDKGEITIPAENIEAFIRSGAKKTRMGNDALRAIFVDEVENPVVFEYAGPKGAKERWENGNFLSKIVVIQKSRIEKTRPIFHSWTLSFTVTIDTEIVNEQTVDEWVETSCSWGLNDYRPRYGRSILEKVNGEEYKKGASK